MREVGAEVKELEASSPRSRPAATSSAATLPNLPDPRLRTADEDDAVVLREVGERPDFEFEVRDHLDLGLANGWIEMEKAAEASGSRFAYLLGDLVLVGARPDPLRGRAVGAEGFVPVVPPVLVREGPLYGTGFFPGEREMIYEIERDELFLVGTSEVSLAALHADEILDAPTCRAATPGSPPASGREAGAAGKDTRGIFRVHQFDKVEMFSFVAPRSRRPSTSACSRSRRGSSRRSRSPTGSSTSPSATWARPRPQVRLRGLDPEPGALPRGDLVLEHHRLPGAAPRRALPARARGARRCTPTRSTAPRSRSAAR